MLKHGDPQTFEPYLRWCLITGYFTSDYWYETLVDECVVPETSWLDIGCGRSLFPTNHPLAKKLSSQCRTLVGLDPDSTILENPFVHERANCMLDEFKTNHKFDLITMRMVAGHVADPVALIKSLQQLMTSTVRIIIYTPFIWSPLPVLTRLIPFNLHHPIKKFFWGTEDKDTFPVAYKMNTRATLSNLFQEEGIAELGFAYLNDCRTLHEFSIGFKVELTAERLLRGMGWHYPEVCILGVYGPQSKFN